MIINKVKTLSRVLLKSSLAIRCQINICSDVKKPSVYVTRDIRSEARSALEAHCNMTIWDSDAPVPRDELINNVAGKDGLLCLLTDKIDAEVLDAAGPNLKVIATMSVGYDHLNIKEIRKRNIKIGYTPYVLTDATAELTVALLLAASRRLLEASNEARTGGWKTWSPFWMCGPGLNNSTVGIVGFGRIGKEVARRLKAFNVKNILYTGHSETEEAVKINAKFVSLDKLLQECDFITANCSLTPETTKLFNDDTFKKMKPSAVFVNTSRGGVVDQDALVRALKEKTIWAAGIDVTTPEPLPLDHELFKLKNCVILPHIGSATIETRNIMAMLAVNNILATFSGRQMPAELTV